MSKICISLFESNFHLLKKKVQQALQLSKWVELRLDLMPFFTPSHLADLFQCFDRSCFIVTARRNLEAYLEKHPLYFDLDWNSLGMRAQKYVMAYKHTRFILSCHQSIDDGWEETLKNMQLVSSHHIKLALESDSSLKAMRFFRKVPKDKMLFLVTGQDMEAFRPLSAYWEVPWTYAYLKGSQKIVQGQVSAEDLLDVYRFDDIDGQSKVYALIGDPVGHSIGHLWHNARFSKEKKRAFYIKFPLKKEELSDFMGEVAKHGVVGLSVTMPHKESILTFAKKDAFVSRAKSANTLLRVGLKWFAKNTDAPALIELLGRKKSLQGKQVFLIGAGGAARAFAHALFDCGCVLSIFNRSLDRAFNLAKEVSGNAYSLEDLNAISRENPYDILLQASSLTLHQKTLPHCLRGVFLKSTLVLDIASFEEESAFISEAKKQGCLTFSYGDLYEKQAEKQFPFHK